MQSTKATEVDVLNSVTYLNWFSVASRTDTKKTCFTEIGPYAQNMTTILYSIVNTNWEDL